MEDLKSIPTWKMDIFLWPEIPRKPGTERWTYESFYLPAGLNFFIDNRIKGLYDL